MTRIVMGIRTNVGRLQAVILDGALRRNKVESRHVESKIEALVQADFEIASEIAGAHDRFPHSDGCDKVDRTGLQVDVLAALRWQRR